MDDPAGVDHDVQRLLPILLLLVVPACFDDDDDAAVNGPTSPAATPPGGTTVNGNVPPGTNPPGTTPPAEAALPPAPECASGTASLVNIAAPDSVADIAVDRDYLYVITVMGHLSRLPRCGDGDLEPLADLVFTFGFHGYLTLDRDNVYAWWLVDNQVQIVPKTGGTPGIIAVPNVKQFGNVLSDGTNLIYTAGNADGTHMLAKIPIGGGDVTPIEIPPAGSFFPGLALSGTDLYWTELAGRKGFVFKMPVAGGDKTNLWDKGLVSPGEVVIDGDYVYTAGTVAPIQRVPKAGGEPEPLFVNPISPNRLVATATDLYWTATGMKRVSVSPMVWAKTATLQHAAKAGGEEPTTDEDITGEIHVAAFQKSVFYALDHNTDAGTAALQSAIVRVTP